MKLMRAGALNPRQETWELANAADATQVLAAEVSTIQYQTMVQCTRRLGLPIAGGCLRLFLRPVGNRPPGVTGGQLHCVASNNPAST